MLMITGRLNVVPVSVSQISNWGGDAYNPESALDGDLETMSHTDCALDTDLWYKMNFDTVYCFSEVVILQSHWDWNARRMQGTKVMVVDRGTGAESLCGVLDVSSVHTQAGQTYRIPCDGKCGDEVELRLRHNTGQYQDGLLPCIHMREIEAFIGGKYLYHI